MAASDRANLSTKDRIILLLAFALVAVVAALGVTVARDAAESAQRAVDAVEDEQTAAEQNRHDTCIQSRTDTRAAVKIALGYVVQSAVDPDRAGRIVAGLDQVLDEALPNEFCDAVGER